MNKKDAEIATHQVQNMQLVTKCALLLLATTQQTDTIATLQKEKITAQEARLETAGTTMDMPTFVSLADAGVFARAPTRRRGGVGEAVNDNAFTIPSNDNLAPPLSHL